MRFIIVAGTFALTASAFGQGRVIITEIMYDPASNERNGETEWVEIANVGGAPIELTDWRLDDEDKSDWGKFSCTLAPGGVAVLVNAALVTNGEFLAAWAAEADGGPGSPAAAMLNCQIIPVTWGSLANSPTADNETLQLLNDQGEVVCEVNIQTGGDWPTAKNGPSIYLTDVTAMDLSDGKLWRRAEVGVDGCRANAKTPGFDGADVGSPGFVPGLTASGAPATPITPPPAATQPATAPDDNTIDY